MVQGSTDSAPAVTTARDRADTLVRERLGPERVYASAPIGLALLDPNFRFLLVNDKLAEINGVPVEGHIGRAIRELVPAVADQAEAMQRRRGSRPSQCDRWPH